MAKCPKCGEESRIKNEDNYCHSCGFPLKAENHDEKTDELKTVFVDADSGTLIINGIQISKVTEFSLEYKKGNYQMIVSHDEILESSLQSSGV